MSGFNRIIAVIALCSTVFLVSAPGSANAVSIGAQPHLRPRAHGHSHHDRSLSLAEKSYEVDLRAREGPRRRCKSKSTFPSHPSTKTKPCKPKSASKSHTHVEEVPSPVMVNKTKPCKLKSSTTSHISTIHSKVHTSSPTPSNTAPPISSGGRKVGLAWAGNDDNLLKYFVTEKTGYLYTWGAQYPAKCTELGLQCASMLWGNKNLEAFRQYRSGAKILMGMNEVNQPGQSNLSPKAGRDLWNAEILPYKQGRMLVSPSVTCQASGLEWFKEFFAHCGNDMCGVDVLNIHIYVNSAAQVIEDVTLYHETFKLPIFLTEYACQDFSGKNQQCSGSQITDFHQTLSPWFDKMDYVLAHFPFGFLSSLYNVNPGNKLIDSNGMPNALGKYILNT